MASRGLSLVLVAPQGSWYEPSKVPTRINYWPIITHLKGVWKVLERTLKMTRKTVLNDIKQA